MRTTARTDQAEPVSPVRRRAASFSKIIMFSRYRYLLLCCLVLPALLIPEKEGEAQRRLADRIDPIEELDPERGETFLDEFRQLGLLGAYSFEFELRTMPFRGTERLLEGELWGGRNHFGPVTLIEIADREDPGTIVRLLVQSGEESAVWRVDFKNGDAGDVRRLSVDDWFEPIIGTDYTAFDLQMPFVFWDEFEYEGIFRVRGRPCHIFRMVPPASFREERPGLSGVRMFLDAEFQALFRAESIGEDGEVERVFSVIDFKKVQDEWIVKTIDLRDERTRDKTRFRVNRAALHLDLADDVFDPDNLTEEPPRLEGGAFSSLN